MNKFFTDIFKRFKGGGPEIMVATGVIGIIMLMIIPMPTFMLDIFMTINLLLSIVIILNVMFIKSPLEFSVFPTMLLISTVFSLAVNISSTRLILTQGENFDGKLVRAFGKFVVGGGEGAQSLVVGIIIFAILVVVQFLVITKGSTRVSEVSARFALDALTGKQLAIDNELSLGAITEEQSIQRRKELQREVDFYGSMDGASKFVSGNVKAGLLITVINIFGGIIIGTLVRGEPIASAFVNYVQLTIGDGLVSQLPALLISTSSGIIVTRSVSEGNISEELKREFTNYTRIYYIAGGLLCVLAILPGFPWYVLFPIGLFLIAGAYFSDRKKNIQNIENNAKVKTEAQDEAVQTHAQKLESLDPISLEVGYDLVPLVQDDDGQADLLNRISSIRREIGIKMGVVIPLVRVVDSFLLDPAEYSIKFNSVEMGRGRIRVSKLLAIKSASSNDEIEIEGEPTKDPTFGLPSLWIDPTERARAEKAGYTVADPAALISTHISTIIESYAAELLTRQDTANLLDQLGQKQPALVEEVNKHISIGIIQRVFQRLLKEKVSIRNLTTLCETLGDFGESTKDVDFLVEKSRQALSRQIAGQYVDNNKTIHAYMFNYALEKTISDSVNSNVQSTQVVLSQEMRQKIVSQVSKNMSEPLRIPDNSNSMGYVLHNPVLVVSENTRPFLEKLLASNINKKSYVVPVLSTAEIPDEYNLHILGSIGDNDDKKVSLKTEENKVV